MFSLETMFCQQGKHFSDMLLCVLPGYGCES
jgi:hypothetical protein